MSDKTVCVKLDLTRDEATGLERLLSAVLFMWAMSKAAMGGAVKARQAIALALSSDNARSVNGEGA